MSKHLHIVCHEVPWPVSHGGLVDLFYKIVSLNKLGIKIHLHCFSKTMKEEISLNKYCHSVSYYKRQKLKISFSLPYIVSTRSSSELIRNLKMDDYPILLEGIHCSYPAFSNKLQGKNIYIRLHNVETLYYKELARIERNIFKKIYFEAESILLFNYEKLLARKNIYVTVSAKDRNYYQNKLQAKEIHFIPVFIGDTSVSSVSGSGSYCLYHGNLSVIENEEAAIWLIHEVFSRLNIQLIVAGRSPSQRLADIVKNKKNIELRANPTDTELTVLLKNAHINVLPSLNQTGVKLKVLNALFKGRHCIVNEAAVEGASLTGLCHICSTSDEMINKISELFTLPFTDNMITNRIELLSGIYNNEQNAAHLISLIFRHYPKPSLLQF